VGVLVIDEKGIMRDGLCALLSGAQEFEIVGSESTAADALLRELASAPDVVVADLPRLNCGGADAIKALKDRWPDVRVLVLTFQKDERTIDSVLGAGADGYVLKNDSCNELFTAVRSVAAGKGFISPSIYDHVVTGYVRARQPHSGRGAQSNELTDRERQVMRYIASGHRTREIAKLLSLSHKTIEKHRTMPHAETRVAQRLRGGGVCHRSLSWVKQQIEPATSADDRTARIIAAKLRQRLQSRAAGIESRTLAHDMRHENRAHLKSTHERGAL
jgi:two-component system, NarL family, response regulator NreC